MKLCLLLFVALLWFSPSTAQNKETPQVKGYIYDATQKEALFGVSINCIRTSDSVKIAFAQTNENGAFVINSLPVGNYYLMISYLGYKQLSIPVGVPTLTTTVDLKQIFLRKTSLTLSEIAVVGQKPPLRAVSDTMEFNSGYFKVEENAMVGEVFKKIPGVRIDKDGTIRVNGEVVKNLLVNGQPFFADAPDVAIKNLRADIIDKIQLVDRKIRESDPMAVNGEQKEKVINIITKPAIAGKWNGQLLLGMGLSGKYMMKANFTRFSGNSQFALLTEGDNINGIQNGMGSGGGGQMRRWFPGVSYFNRLNDKLKINLDYRYENTHQYYERNTNRRTFVGDSSIYLNQQSKQNKDNTGHHVNLTLNYSPDSLWNVKYTIAAGFSDALNIQDATQGMYGNHLQMTDTGKVRTSMDSRNQSIANGVYIEKRFRKQGSVLSVNLIHNVSNNGEDNYNYSKTTYWDAEGRENIDTLDQYGMVRGKSQLTQFAVTQRIPIFKENSLVFMLIGSRQHTNYHRNVYDFDQGVSKFSIPNDSLSNNFNTTNSTGIGRITLDGASGKFQYNVSLSATSYNFDLRDVNTRQKQTVNDFFIMPMISLNYSFSPSRRMKLNLNGFPAYPSTDQLRPVYDNSNPLLIRKGNPDLKTGKSYNMYLTYNSLAMPKMYAFNISLNASYFKDQVVSASWMDSLNRQIIQPMNVSGAYSLSLNAENSFYIKSKETSIFTGTAISLRKDVTMVNNQPGSIKNWAAGQSVNYSYAKSKLFNFSTGANVAFNSASYANNPTPPQQYFSYGGSFEGKIFFPFGLTIGTNMNYGVNTGRGAGFNTSALLMNAFAYQTLFSRHQGVLRLDAFDLLNQNVSTNRTVTANYIEDERTNVLTRFFILSFTYFIKPK